MKRPLLILALLSLPVFIWFFWQYSHTPETISSTLKSFDKAGEETKKDLSRIPSLPVTEDENSFTMQDDTQTGISITYANQQENNQLSPEESDKDLLSLSFPKDVTKPIEIKLDTERIITIQDLKNQQGFTQKLLTQDIPEANKVNDAWYQKLFKTLDPRVKPEDNNHTYLTSTNQRKTLIHTFQKDHATNEKKLKSWTLYEKGNGIEEEAYRFTNAKIKINDDGNAEVFYFGEKEIQNQQTQADVEPSLLERAQRVISQDMGEDILNSNKNPDFLIPKPFFYDKNGDIHETDWKYDEETNTLSLQISTKDDLYPIALDPTLAFTAPAQSNTGWVVTAAGEIGFGSTFVAGDFNADGKTDLVVGNAYALSQSGRVYIFYNDGAFQSNAMKADVLIENNSAYPFLGQSMTAGDVNSDGKTDLIAGAKDFGGGPGAAFIFYNDGSYPVASASADIIITGEASSQFGTSMTSGDFNADGKTDLAVGTSLYTTSTGRVYIFYNDGSIPTTAATADVIISGQNTNNSFGWALSSGDFNTDGRTDLIVSASDYDSGSSDIGRVYIFYNDGSIPTTAATADVIITGAAGNDYFGVALTPGDFNADGKTDFSVGTYHATAYIFYNDGSYPATAATAEVTITDGGSSGGFGYRGITSGDFNADGRTDLAIGSEQYASHAGVVYIFYNDGSIPTTSATADVMITGAGTDSLGWALVSGDFNADGKIDLGVCEAGIYASSNSRVYIFYSQNGQVNTNVNLTGETTSNYFGYAMTSGDFNADGRTDLAVGAMGYSTNTGRAYIFYNDGSIPTAAASADVVITGETTSNRFGCSLSSGDFNANGKVDLIVGAYQYSSSKGRAYIFYNDGSIPTTAATADVTIDGEAASDSFGYALVSGDFNADSKTDFAVGAYQYSGGVGTGRAYVLYNDGSIPTTAATADAIMTGESTGHSFGWSLTSGDWNADGKVDLAVGAIAYSSSAGRAYIFYDGSITTENASGADVIITGEASSGFGNALASGDFNADGRTDLIIGANSYSSSAGRAYIFYNDGSIPTTAATADIIITGEASSSFGASVVSGDFNADGRIDFVVGGSTYTTNTGRAYIFYNDGSIPTTAATADIIITGETTSNYFGSALMAGDFGFDGKIDLAVGAYGYTTNTGRVYLYETRDNFAWQLQSVPSLTGGLRINPSFSGQELKITGEVGTGGFGNITTSGDLNADGKTDLIVGASNHSSGTGRVYIFYNDGHLAAAAMSADVVISGEGGYFSNALTVGDFNADGKTDLAVGAYQYSANTGRAYIFYNDGSIPTTAATADIIITGEGGGQYFGTSLASGDLNADGKTDLAVGAFYYASAGGRVYLFYNDGSYPSAASSADQMITGSGGVTFGNFLATGDFNADGKTDLIGAAYQGERYALFYNDGSYTTDFWSADLIISANVGSSSVISAGDMNADGKTDIVIGEPNRFTNIGQTYILYNDGTYPTAVSSADIILQGEGGGNYFGASVTVGDLNADGKTDLIVGAYGYSTTGRTYIFYNDGSYPAPGSADIILDGESPGNALATGDFNADGKTDLVVGATGYASSRGRAYMYTFNDGAITGETTSNQFGYSLTSGDFNADGKTDLAVGANGYSTSTGRAYLFYNDGSLPTAATGADVIITGEANSQFGLAMTSGDFNADGKTDLIVGATQYSSYAGRAYLFYNDGSIPTTAATADVIITGAANDSFGGAFAAGDFNFDGETDVVVLGAGLAKVFLFYNDGSIPVTSATADLTITGFGIPSALISGDFNADGRVDLAIGDVWQSSGDYTGKTYLFYNDGSIPTTAGTADLTITGETTSNYFGISIASGDFNADSKTDLAVGARAYSSSTGRTYIFYNDGSIPTTAATADVIITGEAASNYFGFSLTSGDFNADGRVDLAVGAHVYSGTNAGRVYIFYNDGSIPTTAASADVILSSSTGSQSFFGWSLTSGDFNADGKVDLGVGSYLYSNGNATGRVYILTTEAKVEEALPQLQSIGSTNIIGNFEVR